MTEKQIITKEYKILNTMSRKYLIKNIIINTKRYKEKSLKLNNYILELNKKYSNLLDKYIELQDKYIILNKS